MGKIATLLHKTLPTSQNDAKETRVQAHTQKETQPKLNSHTQTDHKPKSNTDYPVPSDTPDTPMHKSSFGDRGPNDLSTRSKHNWTTGTPHRRTPPPFPLTDPRVPRTRRSPYITRYGRAVRHLAQATLHKAFHIHDHLGKKQSIATLRNGPEGTTWERSLSNEYGRLAQGVKRKNKQESIDGTDTIFFIKKEDVPKGRKVTYANYICDFRPNKAEKHRVRLTAGGDKLEYPGDPASPTVSLIDVKLHLNSVISDAHRGARYIVVDIKNFYLGTPMGYYQYMKIHRKNIPQEILTQYELEFDKDGYVYVEIRKGMYGLKEAGKLAHQQLVQHLDKYGYHPMEHIPGLWVHRTRPTTFTLCVDDFGIKTYSDEDTMHLVKALKDKYEITIDNKGEKYLGLTIGWDYPNGTVDISMPGYIKHALERFNHPQPSRPQHSPHEWHKPVYGSTKQQQPTTIKSSPALSDSATKRIQSITGTLLYYARGVDPTMLPALNEISAQQSAPTQDTETKVQRLMDYAATHPDATIRFHASDMILYVASDAAYLVLPKARSRAGGHYFLGNKPADDGTPDPTPNGAIHTLCKTIRNVVASAAEAETGGLYLNGQEAVPIRTALAEMGHPQPPTPLETDNSTAYGIITSTIRQKLSKAFDMRWYWLKDRVRQRQFHIHWQKGKLNMADYFTKHHPPWYHKMMRFKYLLRTIENQKHKPTKLLAIQQFPKKLRQK